MISDRMHLTWRCEAGFLIFRAYRWEVVVLVVAVASK